MVNADGIWRCGELIRGMWKAGTIHIPLGDGDTKENIPKMRSRPELAVLQIFSNKWGIIFIRSGPYLWGEDREVLQVNANPIEVDEASTQYKVMRIIIWAGEAGHSQDPPSLSLDREISHNLSLGSSDQPPGRYFRIIITTFSPLTAHRGRGREKLFLE